MRIAGSRRHLQAGGLHLRTLLPLLLTIIVVAIGIAAGIWQSGRAVSKQQIEVKLLAREAQEPLRQAPQLRTDLHDAAQISAALEPYEYRHLRIKGEFLPDWPVFLENRPYQGKVGFYVLMPFKVAAEGAAQYILVARGWVARDTQDRSKLPNIITPGGTVEIAGVIRQQAGRLLQLGSRPVIKPGAIVQNLEVAEFAQASGLALQPYILEQLDLPAAASSVNPAANPAVNPVVMPSSASFATPSVAASAPAVAGDTLVRDWPRASSGVDKHRGYAFQWFGLAAAACIFYVYTGIRRARNPQ